jgi:putative peptidoglycan lipid II flippase
VVIGYVLLRRRLGSLDLTRVFGTVGRLTVAAGVAARPTRHAVYAMVHLWGESKAASAAELVIGAFLLLAVYLAAAFGLRVREVRELGDMLRTRLGR